MVRSRFQCILFVFLIKIPDGSLSDTAVGMPGFDRSRRNPNQRSPKCETPTRDRGFGTGMGKKSNSTSQLSATGKLIHPHSSLSIFALISFIFVKTICRSNEIEKNVLHSEFQYLWLFNRRLNDIAHVFFG